MKLLSLIILTYNSEKDIYNCLKSVYQYNDIGDGLEIIIVDNNSINYAEMYDRIKSLYPEIKIIANDKNGGYGQGNNVGIRAASAPIVSIMNPDVRLVMPTFKLMINCLQDEKVIMCGGKQYKNENTSVPSFRFSCYKSGFSHSIGLCICRKYDKYLYRHMWLQGAFFAIKKEHFEQIGLFDETIFMYGEEFDIHTRLRKTFPHKKIVFLKDLHYLHLIEDRIMTFESLYPPLRSEIVMCQKHKYSIKKYIFDQKIANVINWCMMLILFIFKKRPYTLKSYHVVQTVLSTLEKEFIK